MVTSTQYDVLKEIMLTRGSVKSYDATHVMPEEEINELLTLASSAPSSWNLQHWRYLVISKPEQKQKMLPVAYGQKQVVEASIVVAILGDLEAYRTAHQIYGDAVEQGIMTRELRDNLVSQIEGAYADKLRAQMDSTLNCGLTAMQLMLTAKSMGYDSCPMGGFNPQKLIQEFNVPERYFPVLLVSIGKAAQPARPSSRLSLNELVIRESF
ncbi:nitroreductase family protein [Shimazuella sp. AN120528]|uniref:nitroreductase family protein n=1 Tax=Shimazuella soli TaxID=1892854 RepID=UPI001F0D4C2B|nr:nitroreductase family protein [Shimazuella soli]MCH5584815.1 nitroreductase family protein [Shimazuella soli]